MARLLKCAIFFLCDLLIVYLHGLRTRGECARVLEEIIDDPLAIKEPKRHIKDMQYIIPSQQACNRANFLVGDAADI